MSDTAKKVSQLEAVVRRPSKQREPSNFALWWAWGFYNLVALVFDIIASVTVFEMMQSYIYAALTFMAGFVPLLMHEFLYTRAYASRWQKVLAVVGAMLSVGVIFVVGVLAALYNLADFQADKVLMEVAMIVGLVIVTGLHALLAAVYFYIDEGIRSAQVRAENMAYHRRRLDDIGRAKEILAMADVSVSEAAAIANQYGSAAALDDVLAQLRGETLPESAPAAGIAVDPQRGFVPKEAATSPLPEVDAGSE